MKGSHMNYLYNHEEDVALFRKLFGSAWETAAELDNSLGAFVMLDDKKRVVLDENSAHCFGLTASEPHYDRMKELLSFANSRSTDFAVRFLSTDAPITAGFVRRTASAAPDRLHFRLCSREELAQAAMQDTDATVMMLAVGGAEGSTEERDSCLFSAVDTIFAHLPAEAMMARISEAEFRICLPRTYGKPEALAEQLCEAVRSCTVRSRLGTVISEHRILELRIGICCGSMGVAYKMHAAEFALYEAKSGKSGSIRLFMPEKYEERKEEYSSLMKFSRLLSENLFVYHFQPIVSAHTGEIVAYEALMRSAPTIGYGPLDILRFAEKRGKLYDIELATLRNTLTAISENQSFFDERKLFVNSIPSQILTDADFSALRADFGELTEKAVIEMTEHTELTDETLAFIKQRLGDAKMQFAIDDYGTGYSNTSNLMRYAPDYLKLDRSLIADIDRDPKKQSLLAGIIEFAHSNGCMALAEGVETLEEARTVIRLSVDLLQGYYVSRPKPVLISEISESVREEITKINLEAHGSIRKVCRAKNGDVLDLGRLTEEKYTDIFAEGGRLTLNGSHDNTVRLALSVKEGAECEITLRNVRLESDQSIPILTLAKESSVRLVIEGDNLFSCGGINVPAGSKLCLSGAGRLTVTSESTYCYGIGSIPFEPFGDIRLDMDGTLRVFVNGEKTVGIGGGRSGTITASSGALEVICTGTDVVAVGSFDGDAPVCLHDCGLTVNIQSVAALCVGAIRGSAEVKLYNIAVDVNCSGASLCAIGTLGGSTAKVSMKNMTLKAEMNGRRIINVGSSGGEADCEVANAELTLNCEGGSVTGIGDPKGGGNVRLLNTMLAGAFRTGEPLFLGSPNGTYTLENSSNLLELNP